MNKIKILFPSNLRTLVYLFLCHSNPHESNIGYKSVTYHHYHKSWCSHDLLLQIEMKPCLLYRRKFGNSTLASRTRVCLAIAILRRDKELVVVVVDGNVLHPWNKHWNMLNIKTTSKQETQQEQWGQCGCIFWSMTEAPRSCETKTWSKRVWINMEGRLSSIWRSATTLDMKYEESLYIPEDLSFSSINSS